MNGLKEPTEVHQLVKFFITNIQDNGRGCGTIPGHHYWVIKGNSKSQKKVQDAWTLADQLKVLGVSEEEFVKTYTARKYVTNLTKHHPRFRFETWSDLNLVTIIGTENQYVPGSPTDEDQIMKNKMLASLARRSASEKGLSPASPPLVCQVTPSNRPRATRKKVSQMAVDKSQKASQQRPCQGWTAEKLYDLFQLSFQHFRQDTAMEVTTPAEIGLSPIYKNRKDFPNLAFFRDESADDDNKTCYVLRSRQCAQYIALGTMNKSTRLCDICGPLRQSVFNLQSQAARKVRIHAGMRVTTSAVAKLSGQELVSLVDTVRTHKDRKILKEKRKLERCKALMEK
jgi:hypothetical protein